VPLPEYVYRALRSAQWKNSDGSANVNAFRRRPPPSPEEPSPDFDGISVGLTPDSAREALRKCHGIARISVAAIRASGKFNVVQDGEEHANIVGLPFDTEANATEVIRCAIELADLAEIEP
jgi:hypothetical protein